MTRQKVSLCPRLPKRHHIFDMEDIHQVLFRRNRPFSRERSIHSASSQSTFYCKEIFKIETISRDRGVTLRLGGGGGGHGWIIGGTIHFFLLTLYNFLKYWGGHVPPPLPPPPPTPRSLISRRLIKLQLCSMLCKFPWPLHVELAK